MRKLIVNASWIGVAATLIVIVSAPAAQADQKIVAKVPFAFIVGDSRMPAGNYIIKDTADEPGMVSVANVKGGEFARVATVASPLAQTPAATKVVFERFGGQYFLAGFVPQGNDGRDILLTPAIMERELVAVGQNQ